MKRFMLGLLFAASLYADHVKEGSLTIGFMPYLAPSNIVEKYTPLAEYLSKKLHKKVEVVVAKDYVQYMKNVKEGHYDINFLGGSPYITVADEYGNKNLLARYEFEGKPTFRAVIFTDEKSQINSLKELEGKSVAFGSKLSTLATQVPIFMLYSSGVGLDKLKSYRFLTNQENAILSVKLKQFDAAAVSEEQYLEHKDKGIKVLAYSQEVSTHLFVAKKGMDKKVQNEIKNILLEMKKSTEGRDALNAISKSLSGFAEVKDSDYNNLREMLKVAIPIIDGAK